MYRSNKICTNEAFLMLLTSSPDYLAYVMGLVYVFEQSEKRIYPLKNGGSAAALMLDEKLSILLESAPPCDLEPETDCEMLAV